MTARTRHGKKAHRATHGADPGTPHERMNRMHAMPNRAEGQMMGGGGPSAPAPMPDDSMGAGPSTDSEEGEQT